MLSLLKIKNLALVEEIQWDLSSGLTAVTGETGAGKSVITGALKLIMGERADKGVIRSGQSTCSVEVIFDLSPHNLAIVNTHLEALGLEACDHNELIIKRVITATSNKQFVNNSAVTLSGLKLITADLIDLHGPHDHQKLLQPSNQLSFLDRFASNELLLEQYQEAWSHWRSKKSAYEELEQSDRLGAKEVELLQYQLDEIDQLEVTEEEVDALYTTYETSQNAQDIRFSGEAILAHCQSEQGLEEKLNELQRLGRNLSQVGKDTEEVLAPIEEMVSHLEDLQRGLDQYLGTLDLDQEEVLRVSEQVEVIESLKRKFGGSFASIIEHKAYAETQIKRYENHDEELALLLEEVNKAYHQVEIAAQRLTKRREVASLELAAAISDEIKVLGFKQAAFEIQVQTLSEPTSKGLDGVEFLFSPNPGEANQPLNQVASSGELSRVTLGIKSVLSQQDRVEVQVFDEIDANVGGEIAKVVGEKMMTLSQHHQILTISHFPQVAAMATQHMLVHKEVVDNKTTTYLKALSQEERKEELRRMLGGGGKEVEAMALSLLAS